ncbi:GNAT family N-acetyltransferase [Streptomonospora nanhaiensis]|uniref:DNA-binding MarR family transcriptional regulator/predicted N-acetyltransferase YhbS n=1 Tax=Streptomonospora nanhaiensis TaxID=1323731 RepID=A0A853BQB1_9ACTN|nr:bifunctional helix-turn-helix transcriptional regulator/GNAT family N-acetyltransferase [Streptomonospora nanhaiensis]MBV2363827.1 bifunctional helix-turn-helix transcriptional regulator/GNAT family N-acetyltransferase [Streptomonospora nanhaiensis]MBX9388780.1 bifunctional helix-turn-helix transcriptional regulator/GNAT family N-acetyltransferase [Streptomonospora nanhaiensis]NYI97618.1 DNA-binding MarR family transcriptional regulator/predicted N-acetyltransferase YhbS [Streptomonospora nan
MGTTAAPHVPPRDVFAIRAFNRFFTRRVGVLRPTLLDSPWTLTEVRIMYELRHRGRTEALALRRDLDMDPGQLSRVLSRLERGGLVVRSPSPDDGRRQLVELTAEGSRVSAELDERSNTQIEELIAHLAPADRQRLLAALATVRHLLDAPAARRAARGGAPEPAVLLRAPRPGDLGWVVERHGALYAAEYGWDRTFEASVARIVADFGAGFDPAAEAMWIAELDGERVGCVACVRDDAQTARLRLLFVEPSARGLGTGSRLVGTCVAFAREAGYRRMTLSTVSVLRSALRIYEAAGFRLTRSAPARLYGADLVPQDWDMDL